MMLFVYEICPHCMDQLIERKQPIEDGDSVNYCPKCGKKLVMACFGEQRIDDTTYKIILNDASLADNIDKKRSFIERLMKMGNLTFAQALEKYKTKDCLIFERNVTIPYNDSSYPENAVKIMSDEIIKNLQKTGY